MNIVVFVAFSRIFLLGILIFKGLTARRLYKSFGVMWLSEHELQRRILLANFTEQSPSKLSENFHTISGTG
jgi:hypothetical protein